MRNISIIIIFFFLLVCAGFAQELKDPLKELKDNFEAFKYSEVIVRADSLLKSDLNLKDGQLLEIYRMKGISEYSLLEDRAAENSFLSILKIDNNYQLDSAKTSPKIITFFEQVKSKYFNELNAKQKKLSVSDTSHIPEKVLKTSSKEFRNTIARSLLVPGLGQLYKGERLKGIILTSLSVASLASMVYFIVDANNKEKDYLATTDPMQFQNKYDDFNKSYKMKNISIISFAIVWLYSQIDILFFTDFNNDPNEISVNLPNLNYDKLKGIQLGYNFHF